MPSPGRRATPPRVLDEVGQIVLQLDVDRLGVGGGVAETLHHQIGVEAEAGQLLELVAGHGPGGVLGADRGHARLAVGAGAHAAQSRRPCRRSSGPG